MTRWPCFLGNQCFNHLYLFFFIFLFHLCVVGLEWPDRSYPGGGRGAVCKVTSRRRNKCDTWIKVITAYYCNILQPFLSFQILLTSTIQLNQLEDIWIYTIIYIYLSVYLYVYIIYMYMCVYSKLKGCRTTIPQNLQIAMEIWGFGWASVWSNLEALQKKSDSQMCCHVHQKWLL